MIRCDPVGEGIYIDVPLNHWVQHWIHVGFTNMVQSHQRQQNQVEIDLNLVWVENQVVFLLGNLSSSKVATFKEKVIQYA